MRKLALVAARTHLEELGRDSIIEHEVAVEELDLFDRLVPTRHALRNPSVADVDVVLWRDGRWAAASFQRGRLRSRHQTARRCRIAPQQWDIARIDVIWIVFLVLIVIRTLLGREADMGLLGDPKWWQSGRGWRRVRDQRWWGPRGVAKWWLLLVCIRQGRGRWDLRKLLLRWVERIADWGVLSLVWVRLGLVGIILALIGSGRVASVGAV